VSSTTNHGSPQRIVSNVAFKTTADVVSKSVTLVITVVAARVLSPSDFGVLALAMTTGWLISVASDAGLPLFLAKEAAQSTPMRPLTYASVLRVIRIRLALGALAMIGGLAVGLIVAPRTSLAAFALIVLAQLATAVVDTLSYAYRGIGRIDVESRLTLVMRSTAGVVAVLLLLVQPSLLGLAIALALIPLAGLLISIGIASTLFARGPASFDLSGRRFAGEIGPIGAGILVSALYFRCDVYFVEWWHGLESVGVYNAAFRIVEALRLFPAAVLAVAFPTLCRARDGGPVRQLGTWLLVGGTVLMAAVLAGAPPILELLYGLRFVEGGAALRVLALALPLFFVNYALTHQVIAWQGQHAYLMITLMALAANLVGNLALIPSHGMVGAAASTLVTELVVCAGCLVALQRLGRPDGVPSIDPGVDLSRNSVGAQ
jgi:O-antigen/teichoic acid export membrane protein